MRLSWCESVFPYKIPQGQVQHTVRHYHFLKFETLSTMKWDRLWHLRTENAMKLQILDSWSRHEVVFFANIKTTSTFAATVAATLKDHFEGESMWWGLGGRLYVETLHFASLSPCCVAGKFHLLYRNGWSNYCKHPHSFQLVVIR